MSTDSPTSAAPPLSIGLWFRLSLMMFLQYAIWGAWLPLLFPFLAGHRGFTPGQIGDMFAVGALGAILAPWIAGQIADRYFNTERYLAVAHILGGLLVFQLAWIDTYWAFLAFSFAYSLIYAPTLSLTNSISFHHLPDRDRDFGRVRVWGTIGWIVVGIGVGQWLAFNHSPSTEAATNGLIVELLNQNSRDTARHTFEVAYTDDNGEQQTVTGIADTATAKYLLAVIKGEEPTEEVDAIVLNSGTYDEPNLVPIATANIKSISNKLESMQATLQPELFADFYKEVDLSAGREPRDLNESEFPVDMMAEIEAAGGSTETGYAAPMPTPWMKEFQIERKANETDEEYTARAKAERAALELEFASQLTEKFTYNKDDVENDADLVKVFSFVNRGEQYADGDNVLLQLPGGAFIQRELVEGTAAGDVVRNPETGKLEVYSGYEGIFSANVERVVGRSNSEEIAEFVRIAPLDGSPDRTVPRVDIVSIEPYGLFKDDAIKAYRGQTEQAGMSDAFIVSAVLGVILGVFCLTLPKTPPQRGKQASATSEALAEIRHQPLLALFLLAVPISCIHQFYFVHASSFLGEYQLQAQGFTDWINSIFGVGGGGLMTIGQMTEIAVLALMPLVAKRYSRKTLLTVGILAYGLRMFLFAYVDSIPLPPLITLILGVALHGLCFGCFIFVAFMIVDEETTGDVRASAQSLFNLVIVGIGIIVGSKIAGWVAEWASESGTMNYQQLFSVPMWASAACLGFLIFFYPRKSKHRVEAPA